MKQLDRHGCGIRHCRLTIAAGPGHSQTQARPNPAPAWKHGVANGLGQASRARRGRGFGHDVGERCLDSGFGFHGLRNEEATMAEGWPSPTTSRRLRATHPQALSARDDFLDTFPIRLNLVTVLWLPRTIPNQARQIKQRLHRPLPNQRQSRPRRPNWSPNHRSRQALLRCRPKPALPMSQPRKRSKPAPTSSTSAKVAKRGTISSTGSVQSKSCVRARG